LIAANFRREVTSTVLWLRNHQIDIRCVRATPYKLNEEVLLNFEQIIPVPEAADFMIGISEKSAEARVNTDSDLARYNRRREFWSACLDRVKTSDIRLYDNISPGKDHWLGAGSGIRSCPYELIFGIREARVQLAFNRSEKAENKALFDALFAQKDAIELDFGAPLTWKRLDHKKSSRIEFAKPFDSSEPDGWDEIIEWMIEHLRRLHDTLDGPLKTAASALS
jgi:hypothetical protein